MRLLAVTSFLAVLAACGGSEPAPAPSAPKAEVKQEAEKPAPKSAPAEAKQEEAPAAAEAPPAGGDAPDLASMSDDEKQAYLLKLGKEVYETGGTGGIACQTCHQANGQGMPPSFPPLAGSKDWMKDCKTHAGYVVNGLKGEIEVAGAKYNGVMPAQGNLSDLEIAAVISFERMSWGNDYGMCSPEDVAAAR
jgi:mono/diheme cytochrome c family protein